MRQSDDDKILEYWKNLKQGKNIDENLHNLGNLMLNNKCHFEFCMLEKAVCDRTKDYTNLKKVGITESDILHNYTFAIEAFNKYLESHPDDYYVYWRLSELYNKTNNSNKTLETLKKAVDMELAQNG